MRIVLDTSVLIAGLRSPAGAAAEVLRRVLAADLGAAASTALFLEYEAVATRPEHLSAAGLTREHVLAVIDGLAVAMEPTPILLRIRPMSQDSADDLVIEAALNAGVEAIVTYNPRDFRPAESLGIRVISPALVLSELRSSP
jgi:predicted nucleic acid-binding protein